MACSPNSDDVLKKHPGLGWISALRSGAIRRLLADGHLVKKDLEAERLGEISSPEFPGERLVACYNDSWPSSVGTSVRNCWRPRRPNWKHWQRAWGVPRPRPTSV